ncbi:MAG: hypothetical protein ACI8PT_004612 [Gammaproteobacteria bacterium]|jgi:hypothetical protein
MNALSVVLELEVGEFWLKVARVSKQNVIEKLSPSGANQPFNEGMRNPDVGNRFDFVDFQYPQVGLPAMKLKQRVLIGTEISRWTLPIKNVIEHAAHGGPIDVTAMNAEPDYATRELIHEDQYPVRIEHDRFAAKEVGTPQAILRVTEEGEPRGPREAGHGSISEGRAARCSCRPQCRTSPR